MSLPTLAVFLLVACALGYVRGWIDGRARRDFMIRWARRARR